MKTSAKVEFDGKPVDASFRAEAGRYVVMLTVGITIQNGQRLLVALS